MLPIPEDPKCLGYRTVLLTIACKTKQANGQPVVKINWQLVKDTHIEFCPVSENFRDFNDSLKHKFVAKMQQ